MSTVQVIRFQPKPVGDGPHRAKPETQENLGYASDFDLSQDFDLVPDWHDRALAEMGKQLKSNRAFRLFMESCVKCGACWDRCHYFLGTADPNNMPVARQELLRKVYRRYFTLAGKWLPNKWIDAAELDHDVLKTWYDYFHQCSECRRCATACPMGIDTAEVTMAARKILNAVGLGQAYTHNILKQAKEKGNNLGLPVAAIRDTLEVLSEDVLADTGVAVPFPLDEVGTELMLVVPSADFYAEPHVEGLIGYAKVLHAAGISYTFSSQASEAANFALFNGDTVLEAKFARRIRDAAQALEVKRVVFGECGHAWRVAKRQLPEILRQLPKMDVAYPMPQHMVEVSLALIRSGQVEVDPTQNQSKQVTFHDSCNIARGAPLSSAADSAFSVPRDLLNAVCPNVIEMPADTTHEDTLCCGGGGGMLSDELMPVRIAGSSPRVEAFKQSGASHMVAICAICKAQFGSVFPEQNLEREQVLSLHQLVGDAVLLSDSIRNDA